MKNGNRLMYVDIINVKMSDHYYMTMHYTQGMDSRTYCPSAGQSFPVHEYHKDTKNTYVKVTSARYDDDNNRLFIIFYKNPTTGNITVDNYDCYKNYCDYYTIDITSHLQAIRQSSTSKRTPRNP
jgi:hypothetical protein